ncbi:MAG: FtsX-like permease family protein [Bacteroidota bacterium]|nr:FtsX-like permease family protein [Bacteroidota bacterium]MDX5429994.1 FtsX-like permease family protein [Bacteroidota bacterium]MDX5468767.1 FtsX-like permease family protein [Bacteroidota bacterium]
MMLSRFIARRYLFSRNNPNAINIISGISVLGFTVGAMALVTVMSVFNGFESLVQSLYSSFDPDLKIESKYGKVFRLDSIPYETIKNSAGVETVAEVLEENVVLRYDERQAIATMKGVSESFIHVTQLDSMIFEGQMLLESGENNYAVAVIVIASRLGLSTYNDFTRLAIYLPKRDAAFTMNPEKALNQEFLKPSGVFSIDDDINNKYLIVPLRLARKLLEYDTEVSALEIDLSQDASVNQVQNELQALLGPGYTIKNREQQEETLYKVFRYEKWATALILVFILFLLTFTVISSLSMLVMEKRKDIAILRSMGANDRLIRGIFIREGMLIALSGGLIGLFLGFVLCWLQGTYGLIGFGGMGTFIINAYPVKMKAIDFGVIFLFILILGFITSWFPASKAARLTTSNHL